MIPRVLNAAAERGAQADQDMSDLLADAYIPISPIVGRLLHVLALSRRPGRIVEFGTSHGLSTIYLAAATSTHDAPVITTEAEPSKIAAAEKAEAAVDRHDLLGRWRAAGRAAYRWSGTHASEYALIFGSPVPGYRAPQDTIGPASRFTGVLLGILVDAHSAGLRPPTTAPLAPAIRADFEQLGQRIPAELDPEWLAAGLRAWTSLIGLISLIRFGHLHNVVHDHDAWFDDALERLGRSVIGV